MDATQTQWLIDLGLMILGAVGGFIYRLHINQYKEHRQADQQAHQAFAVQLEKQRNEDKTFLLELIQLRAAEATRESSVTRTLVETRAAEGNKLLMELFKDLRQAREDAAKREEEFWKQTNIAKDRQHSMELQLAQMYHTKDQLAELLEDKLRPLVQSIDQLRTAQNKHSHSH